MKTPIYFEGYLPTVGFKSKAEFVWSMQIVKSMAKIYWKTFFEVVVWMAVS